MSKPTAKSTAASSRKKKASTKESILLSLEAELRALILDSATAMLDSVRLSMRCLSDDFYASRKATVQAQVDNAYRDPCLVRPEQLDWQAYMEILRDSRRSSGKLLFGSTYCTALLSAEGRALDNSLRASLVPLIVGGALDSLLTPGGTFEPRDGIWPTAEHLIYGLSWIAHDWYPDRVSADIIETTEAGHTMVSGAWPFESLWSRTQDTSPAPGRQNLVVYTEDICDNDDGSINVSYTGLPLTLTQEQVASGIDVMGHLAKMARDGLTPDIDNALQELVETNRDFAAAAVVGVLVEGVHFGNIDKEKLAAGPLPGMKRYAYSKSEVHDLMTNGRRSSFDENKSVGAKSALEALTGSGKAALLNHNSTYRWRSFGVSTDVLKHSYSPFSLGDDETYVDVIEQDGTFFVPTFDALVAVMATTRDQASTTRLSQDELAELAAKAAMESVQKDLNNAIEALDRAERTVMAARLSLYKAQEDARILKTNFENLLDTLVTSLSGLEGVDSVAIDVQGNLRVITQQINPMLFTSLEDAFESEQDWLDSMPEGWSPVEEPEVYGGVYEIAVNLINQTIHVRNLRAPISASYTRRLGSRLNVRIRTAIHPHSSPSDLSSLCLGGFSSRVSGRGALAAYLLSSVEALIEYLGTWTKDSYTERNVNIFKPVRLMPTNPKFYGVTGWSTISGHGRPPTDIRTVKIPSMATVEAESLRLDGRDFDVNYLISDLFKE